METSRDQPEAAGLEMVRAEASRVETEELAELVSLAHQAVDRLGRHLLKERATAEEAASRATTEKEAELVRRVKAVVTMEEELRIMVGDRDVELSLCERELATTMSDQRAERARRELLDESLARRLSELDGWEAKLKGQMDEILAKKRDTLEREFDQKAKDARES